MRITILGMGNMGRAFAARALDKGHEVTVWNRSPGRAGDLVGRGAREAGSPAEGAAGADYVLVVLADDAAVNHVCLGDAGALAALAPEAVLINVSTVAPSTSRSLAEEAGGHHVLDAPVLGAPEVIAEGRGRFFVGGDEEAVGAADVIWSDLGSGHTYCGPLGSGNTVKIVVNLLLVAGVSAVAEAVATARSHGVPDELLKAILPDLPVVAPATRARLDSVMDPGHPGWFAPALARKDVRLAIGLAEEAGLAVRIGPATEALLSSVVDRGGDWEDFSAVIEALS